MNKLHTATDEDKVSLKTISGFWIYLMTDCVLFATLFAVFAVMRHSTFGGPGAADLFRPGFVLTETLLLLTSSFTMGLAMLGVQRQARNTVLALLAVSGILGLLFLGMELSEFTKLVHEGNSWQRSGFLSAFFTLVGTHGLHITAGIIWIATLGTQVVRIGFNQHVIRRLTLLSLFWHFLDIVWIFIFSFVYLLGGF